MKILQVSTTDRGGGAEKIAFNLFREYQRQGHQSWLAVGVKRSSSNSVYSIPTLEPQKTLLRWMQSSYQENMVLKKGLFYYFLKSLYKAFGGWQSLVPLLGWEDFNFPGSLKLLTLTPQKPEIIHLHNLHGSYFDLRYLKTLSIRTPTVITMHDEWLYTGHCACSFDCNRWMTGCGKCPDLSIYPAIKHDATAFNLNRKRSIYKQSKIYIATPSQWLFERVQKSILRPLETRVIYNGVDLNIFKPEDPRKIRQELNLPTDSIIILTVINQLKNNPFKDYQTVQHAMERLGGELNRDSIMLLTLGGQKCEENLGNILVRHLPFEADENKVAKYYQAADIFIHSTFVDNFPTTVLEAFACGIPVIGTAIGGVVEQIDEGETGFLIPSKNSTVLADRIKLLIGDNSLRLGMGLKAHKIAETRFDLKRQVNIYLNWYKEILEG
jgi:glycosyltransferase involved in cell wall biosynthesis